MSEEVKKKKEMIKIKKKLVNTYTFRPSIQNKKQTITKTTRQSYHSNKDELLTKLGSWKEPQFLKKVVSDKKDMKREKRSGSEISDHKNMSTQT